MIKMNNVVNFVKSNRSTILVSLGIVGGTLAAVKAVKDTPKALDLIELKKEELGVEKLTAKQTIATCWKVYAPSVLMGIMSGCCVVYGQYYTNKELVGMTTLYGVTASNLDRYKRAVTKVATPEVTKTIKETVAENAVKDAIPEKTKINAVEPINDGLYWCIDSLTGQRFKSSPDKIKNAEISLNDRRINQGYVSATDAMFELDIQDGLLPAEVGWRDIDGKIKIEYDTAVVIDGVPHLYVEYNPLPRPGFDSAY